MSEKCVKHQLVWHLMFSLASALFDWCSTRHMNVLQYNVQETLD